MAANPISWFEIYVSDLARATQFYETVLGVKLDNLDSPDPNLTMHAFPADYANYGASGALVQANGVEPGECATLVYFACDDVAVPAARVEAAGGRVERPKMAIGQYGFIALIVDTEGNLVGLHSQA
ncbi:MAG: VOC family protein [Pseudomonadota bacterium]